MKKFEKFELSKICITHRPPQSENFCAGLCWQGKAQGASPEDYYTGGVLSTYKKFRMVIPNFL